MAQQGQGGAPQPQAIAPVTSPDPWSAAHLTVASSLTEFTVGFGRSRMVFNQQNTVSQAVEWFASISMSPPVAKQLCEALKATIQEYEKINGAIPFHANTMQDALAKK